MFLEKINILVKKYFFVSRGPFSVKKSVILKKISTLNRHSILTRFDQNHVILTLKWTQLGAQTELGGRPQHYSICNITWDNNPARFNASGSTLTLSTRPAPFLFLFARMLAELSDILG